MSFELPYPHRGDNPQAPGCETAVLIGTVKALRRRPLKSAPPITVDTFHFERGLGIVGDSHANPISPRHVLLVSENAYAEFSLPPGSLRENILIGVSAGHLESGAILRFGASAAVAVSFECEPCAKLNRVSPGLMRAIGGARGWLARVVESGPVSCGDSISRLTSTAPRHSRIWQERLWAAVEQLPAGTVATYASLTEIVGVPKAYARAFPRVLRAKPGVPWHRAVPISGALLGPEHRERLKSEGIEPAHFLHFPRSRPLMADDQGAQQLSSV